MRSHVRGNPPSIWQVKVLLQTISPRVPAIRPGPRNSGGVPCSPRSNDATSSLCSPDAPRPPCSSHRSPSPTPRRHFRLPTCAATDAPQSTPPRTRTWNAPLLPPKHLPACRTQATPGRGSAPPRSRFEKNQETGRVTAGQVFHRSEGTLFLPWGLWSVIKLLPVKSSLGLVLTHFGNGFQRNLSSRA